MTAEVVGAVPRKRISRTKRATTYPALLMTQNKHRFYFTTIPVDDLFNYCFVARRDEDPVAGFQRSLNESRADDIAAYLAAGTGSIPSNVVLSAQENANFAYNRKTKSISFARETAAFLVLDGQHRLWGYQKCNVRHRVPVAIYEGLTRSEETKLFIDINTTQRGVPAALLLDIKELANVEDAKEHTLRQIFDRLNADSKSPLAGRLSASKSLANRISRVTFNRAVGPILSSGVALDAGSENRYKLILNFLNAWDAELSEKSLILRSAFFESMFEVFGEVIQNTLNAKKTVKQDAIQTTIRPLARLSYFGTGGRTLLPKKSIVTIMQSTLRKTAPISAEML
ncbi:DGQHR domain-containing protein [Cupriavidus gilardii]|uniref:DGQHR domain-containing protein n=1 Tax=Cupriavidus gilardii TaxID=82541 RepID=UPI000AE1A160|nr:DGQHR domain-containing protein [Cupriavidus gilardii]